MTMRSSDSHKGTNNVQHLDCKFRRRYVFDTSRWSTKNCPAHSRVLSEFQAFAETLAGNVYEVISLAAFGRALH